MMTGYNKHSQQAVKRIPKNAVGAEIGVWRGYTTEKFLESNPKEYHLVDAWSTKAWFPQLSPEKQESIRERYAKAFNIKPTVHALEKYYEEVYSEVCEKFKETPCITIHRADSKKWLTETDIQLDWIYIDGDHTYEGVTFDLEASLRVLKEDGTLLGDDYGNKPGVKKAVDEFVEKHGFKLEVFAETQFQIFI